MSMFIVQSTLHTPHSTCLHYSTHDTGYSPQVWSIEWVDQMWISFKLNSMLWLGFSSGYDQVVES